MDFTPEQIHAAKVAVSGGFGASVLVFLRHPGSLAKAIITVVIGMGMASIFADYLVAIMGFSEIQAGALMGMSGLGIAGLILKAIEHVDVKRVLKRKGL